IDARKIERRRQTERAALVSKSLRSGCERGEERGQKKARAQEETAKGLDPGNGGIHRTEAEGKRKTVGGHEPGLEGRVQWRGVRLGDVSKRERERAGERRIYGSGAGGT